ncbi:MAG TPA: carboxypeptidase-like regulatory domain-containing protein [Pyrinomonadaceae bacterium]|nr:carboxypeptidase-like regulatory domain-containing protein [Pyrinomonadaceae bacterium]
MSKFLISLFLVAATFSVGLAQAQSQNPNDPPNMGAAPKEANGVGRLDLRVVDEDGNPVENAHAKLESTRSDGYFCESWNDTNARGVAVLPPIHMGTLKLKIKAKGFKTMEIEVPASSLNEPVRVTLVRKK